jgi:uncharacterized protein
MSNPNPDIISNEVEPTANGWFQIAVHNDGKIACVKKIVRHTGKGKPVTANDILKKLKELKVVYGIDREAIDELIKSVDEHNIPEEPVVIAKGDVEDGQNSSIEWCIEGISEEGSSFLVVPNMKIAVMTLATQGTKGKNVLGVQKNPRPGFGQQLLDGDGVVATQEEDGVVVYESTQVGMLSYKSGTLSVDSGFVISEDKIQVHMDVYAGKVVGTDNEVVDKDILKMLEIAGIKYGINTDKIKSAIEEAKVSDGVIKNVLVAEGKAPVNGSDSVIQWHVDAESEDINKRAVLPSQLIASIKSSSDCIAGIDVFEEIASGTCGTDIEIICGEGIEKRNTKDGVSYMSLRLGVVQFDSDTLTVKSGVKVSDDKLKVTMSLLRPDIDTNEGDISLLHVITTLKEHGVIFGIKENAIKLILDNINKEKKSKTDLLVAEGKAAVNGSDDVIEWKLDIESKDESKRAVIPGQVIATIQSNSKSISGVNVYKEEVTGIDGTEISLNYSDEIEKVTVNGSDEYRSSWLGIAQFESETLTVDSRIKISSDNLKATMDLIRPDNPTDEGNILLPHVIKTLHEHDVVYGIKNDVIKQKLDELNKEKQSETDFLVAEGLPPKDGVNASIEFDKEISVGGKILPDGKIDYHEKSYPWNVKVNDVVGKLIPPIRAEDGKNVKGEELLANQEKLTEQVLEGIEKEADGTLRVMEDGVLLIDGANLKVTDSLVLEEGVCQKTGNIHSDKTVTVKGYVEAGLVLETKGDAIIQDNVEDAVVNAEGNVVIKSGVRGTHSKIISGGTLSASFAENAELNAKGDIIIANSVMNCHIESQGVVHIGTRTSQKSALVGDVTHALKGVEATILGSDSFSKTVIELGANTDDYIRLKELIDEVISAKKSIDDLNRLFEHSRKNPKPQKEQNALLVKLTETRDLKTKEHEVLKEEKEKIRLLMEESSNAKVIVHKRVYPGVIIRMLNKLHEVKEERGPGEFFLKGEKIIFQPV